ncbi:MAG: outer membrane beta-barrel protein [Bacteroidales bacterium]|nr:outer membrane beta-barrel protein [Bacteroidales bacterium]
MNSSSFRFRSSLIFALVFLPGICVFVNSQDLQQGGDAKRPLIIRSGVSGAFGLSDLHIDNSLRPHPEMSQYYNLHPNRFMRVGAILTFQPAFFGEYFQLVTDPSFTKYSWGNFEYQEYDSLGNSMDIDVETIELPLSLRFSFLPYSKKVQPFLRAGYSLGLIFETEAQFQSKIFTSTGRVELYTEEFPFARFQHALFVSAGVEFNFQWFDLTLELMIQKGEGIDSVGRGSQFMSLTTVSNYSLQLGILF